MAANLTTTFLNAVYNMKGMDFDYDLTEVCSYGTD